MDNNTAVIKYNTKMTTYGLIKATGKVSNKKSFGMDFVGYGFSDIDAMQDLENQAKFFFRDIKLIFDKDM
jgi:hypothetical protein